MPTAREPAPTSTAHLYRQPRGLDPITAELREFLNGQTRLICFNADRWGYENDLFVLNYNPDLGRADGWRFIGSASCLGNVFALIADEGGLPDLADELCAAWFEHAKRAQ